MRATAGADGSDASEPVAGRGRAMRLWWLLGGLVLTGALFGLMAWLTLTDPWLRSLERNADQVPNTVRRWATARSVADLPSETVASAVRWQAWHPAAAEQRAFSVHRLRPAPPALARSGEHGEVNYLVWTDDRRIALRILALGRPQVTAHELDAVDAAVRAALGRKLDDRWLAMRARAAPQWQWAGDTGRLLDLDHWLSTGKLRWGARLRESSPSEWISLSPRAGWATLRLAWEVDRKGNVLIATLVDS